MSRNSFRHGASQIGKGSGKKGKGGGVTWDKWTPPSLNKSQGKMPMQPGVDPAEQLAVPVVLVPGDYQGDAGESMDTFLLRFHKYTTNFNNRKQYPELPCIRGTGHTPQNCIGCLKVERKEWKETSDTKENVCVNMAHLANYHEVPWTKNGQVQTKKGSNDPVMIWKECTNSSIERQLWARENNRTCEGCDQGAKTRIGGRRYLQIGWGNQKQLADFQEDTLSRKCKGCGTGTAQIALKCSGCQMVIHNIENGGYSFDQIKELKEDKQVCANPQCAHANPQNPGYLDSVYRCGYNDDLLGFRADGLKCPEGTASAPHSIYECVLWLIRKGEGTDSRIHVHKWCPITKFPWPGSGQLVDLEASGLIKDAVPTCFDFDTMFKFDTAKQAKMLKMDADPYAAQNYQQMAPQGQAPQGGYPGGYQPRQQAAPQLPPQAQGGYQPQPMMPPQPQGGYAPQGSAPPQGGGYQQQQPAPQQQPHQATPPQPAPIAAPYPQAPVAPGMPPAPGGRPNWGGSGNQ